MGMRSRFPLKRTSAAEITAWSEESLLRKLQSSVMNKTLHCPTSTFRGKKTKLASCFDWFSESDPDIVKLYMRQLFDDHLINKKSWNLILSLASDQRNNHQHLNPKSFRMNERKLWPTMVECCCWNDIPSYLYVISQLRNFVKNALYWFYLARFNMIYLFIHYIVTLFYLILVFLLS